MLKVCKKDLNSEWYAGLKKDLEQFATDMELLDSLSSEQLRTYYHNVFTEKWRSKAIEVSSAVALAYLNPNTEQLNSKDSRSFEYHYGSREHFEFDLKGYFRQAIVRKDYFEKISQNFSWRGGGFTAEGRYCVHDYFQDMLDELEDDPAANKHVISLLETATKKMRAARRASENEQIAA